MNPTIYLDEDVDVAIRSLLVERGYPSVHVVDIGRQGLSDRDQLAYATDRAWIMLVQNVGDYRNLHESGIHHSGVIGLKPSQPRRTCLRAAMIIDWYPSDCSNRMIRWYQFQQVLERGERLPGYSDEEIRDVMGR